jgi:hypothetical protein
MVDNFHLPRQKPSTSLAQSVADAYNSAADADRQHMRDAQLDTFPLEATVAPQDTYLPSTSNMWVNGPSASTVTE